MEEIAKIGDNIQYASMTPRMDAPASSFIVPFIWLIVNEADARNNE